MIEFRWILPPHTITGNPVLQFREPKTSDFGHRYSDAWKTIPVVVVSADEYAAARAPGIQNEGSPK